MGWTCPLQGVVIRVPEKVGTPEGPGRAPLSRGVSERAVTGRCWDVSWDHSRLMMSGWHCLFPGM